MEFESSSSFSNRQIDLALTAGQAFGRYQRASAEVNNAFLEMGDALVEAKSSCSHGQWLRFLEHAGIDARTAQRSMKLARSGVEYDSVSHFGGLQATLERLATCHNDLTNFPPGADPAGDRWKLSQAEFEVMSRETDWWPILGEAMNEIEGEGGA